MHVSYFQYPLVWVFEEIRKLTFILLLPNSQTPFIFCQLSQKDSGQNHTFVFLFIQSPFNLQQFLNLLATFTQP